MGTIEVSAKSWKELIGKIDEINGFISAITTKPSNPGGDHRAVVEVSVSYLTQKPARSTL